MGPTKRKPGADLRVMPIFHLQKVIFKTGTKIWSLSRPSKNTYNSNGPNSYYVPSSG